MSVHKKYITQSMEVAGLLMEALRHRDWGNRETQFRLEKIMKKNGTEEYEVEIYVGDPNMKVHPPSTPEIIRA